MNREEGFKAQAILLEAGMFNKPEGGSALNRKQGAKLRRRVRDYELVPNKQGFHKPGSNKK